MGVTRDAYYKYKYRFNKRIETEGKVIEFAKEIRKEQPRIGCRKLYNEIKPRLEKHGIAIGRDKFIEILGKQGMHVRRKRKFTRTTYSKHGYVVAPNRVKGVEAERPNQVFVSDITYVRLSSGFAYLFLVTDLYSRKIVGYCLGKKMTHKEAISALSIALKDVPDSTGIIHHSDRGCQYCCHEFLKYLGKHSMVPSMTDESHCYQNAVAERVNGILKDEFYIDATFKDFEHARKAVDEAIEIYNTKRPHWSLKLKTPESIYLVAA